MKPRAELLYIGEVYARLARNHDLLSASVVSGVPKALDVVNGAEVVGTQIVIAGRGRGVVGFERPVEEGPRLHAEIVKAVNGADCRLDRDRQGRLGRVGEVVAAIDAVAVEADLQRLFDVARGAGECDGGPARGRPR